MSKPQAATKRAPVPRVHSSPNPRARLITLRREPLGKEGQLPTIEQMSGLLDKPTGDLSLAEYLTRLRDE